MDAPSEIGPMEERLAQALIGDYVSRQGTLKLSVAREAWERDHVADVFHAGGEEDEPLEAEAEPRVGDGAVFAQFQIPPVVGAA